MPRAVSSALAHFTRGSKGVETALARYSGSRVGRAAKFATASRGRRIATGVVAGGFALNAHAAYSRMPGPNRSSRNQNSIFLRNLRRSSGANGLGGNSMGGYTGY